MLSELQHEVELRASSPEGAEALITAVLRELEERAALGPPSSQIELSYIALLKEYIYTKRRLGIATRGDFRPDETHLRLLKDTVKQQRDRLHSMQVEQRRAKELRRMVNSPAFSAFRWSGQRTRVRLFSGEACLAPQDEHGPAYYAGLKDRAS